MQNDLIPEWVRESLTREGWGCTLEWSAPGNLGHIYSLTRGKWDVRVEAQAIPAFLSGLRYGKMQAENEAKISGNT